MTLLHISLLGGFDCRAADGEALTFPTRKVRAVLAYLAANPDQHHGRHKLAGLFWGGKTEGQALANLRKTLSRLRESLAEAAKDCLVTDAKGIAIQSRHLEVDVELFERLAADGTPETLEQAAALYAGEFLDGFAECGEEFDEWLTVTRRRLDETFRQVLQRLLNHYVVTGGIDRAIQIALRLTGLDPLHEGVHRTLIRLYMYQERIGSALDQYRRCRDILASELGIEPAPETEKLKAQLLGRLPSGSEISEGTLRPESDDLPERGTVVQAAAAGRARRRGATTARPSVAVLSFASAGDEEADRHLGDGVAEDITTELGRFRELDVIAPTTALGYREAAVGPHEAGAELGVGYVLDGSLRSLDRGLRIKVRLVETGTGRQLWAERYDCAPANVFDVQDDVVRRIVGTLVGRIEDARLEAAKHRRPEDWQAYDLCLRGWSALRRPDLAAIHEARRFFQRAVAKDPHFGRAYVGLAMAHLNEWACFSWNHWVFLQQEALDLARKAVELDERDHRAHCMLGVAQLYGRDYEGARRQLLKALDLNPNDSDVLAHASFAMALIGEHEPAVEAGRNALRLAPHHPEWYVAFAGIAFFSARLYEEAIETMASAPEALCNTPAFIAASYAHLGQPEEGARHRVTVYRHYRLRVARGTLSEGTNCIDWLLAMDPFRRASDADHYADGLRKAGFE